MRYYEDYDTSIFLEENVETVIELIKKAYLSTKEFYKDNITDDFLYFNMYHVFCKGYCFYFARMLKSVYKNAKFVVSDKNYAHISHIFLLINDDLYDVNGKHNLKKYFILTNTELQFIKENHNPVDDSIYNVFKDYFNIYLQEYIKSNLECITKKCKKYT